MVPDKIDTKWFPAFAGTTPGFPRVKHGAGLVKLGMTIKEIFSSAVNADATLCATCPP